MSNTPRRNRRQKTSLLSKARWAGYAAAGAATALGTYEAADAGIWYSGVLNGGSGVRMNAIEAGTSPAMYPIDLPGNFDVDGKPITNDLVMFHSRQTHVTSNGAQITGSAFANPMSNLYGSVNLARIAGTQVGTYYNADRFLKSSLINAASRVFNNFGTLAAGSIASCKFVLPGEGYVGFSFDDNGDTRYGWLRVIMDGAPENGYSIMDYAYAGANEDIRAGEVPEPGSLGLLAAGGIGLLLWRRRRASRKSA